MTAGSSRCTVARSQVGTGCGHPLQKALQHASRTAGPMKAHQHRSAGTSKKPHRCHSKWSILCRRRCPCCWCARLRRSRCLCPRPLAGSLWCRRRRRRCFGPCLPFCLLVPCCWRWLLRLLLLRRRLAFLFALLLTCDRHGRRGGAGETGSLHLLLGPAVGRGGGGGRRCDSSAGC